MVYNDTECFKKFKIILLFNLRGTVSVISSGPPCKDGNSQFIKVSLNVLCLIQYELNINANNFENGLFSLSVPLQK